MNEQELKLCRYCQADIYHYPCWWCGEEEIVEELAKRIDKDIINGNLP